MEEILNITMNRAELLSAAQRAAAIAPEDSPVEALRGTLLEANAATGTLTLTATNLETALEQSLGCPTAEDDALVVDAKLLAGMLERLPGDTVELKRRPDTPVLSLRSGQAGYDVAIWERGSFPKLEIPFPEDTVKLSGIPSMARHTMFATKEDKGNPLMRCVNLMFTQEGLKGVGYNGRCLVTARGDDKSTGNISLLLPANSLEKLAGLCSDADEFNVGVAGKFLVFQRPGLTFGAMLMEGDYMDTDRLMNNIRNQFTLLTDVADLRRTLKTVAAVDPKGRVKLAFDGGRITFSCKGELGEACQELETAPLTGTPQGGYWYQIPDLMACLRSLSGTATLGIAQAGMLDLSTDNAYYMQTAMREPVAAPVVVRETPKAKTEKAAKAKSPKAKSSKAKTAKKAA
jgi:DNA polymerase III sliding clamp (beta) subunit (PCNA family)